jgi:hypothetical protein
MDAATIQDGAKEEKETLSCGNCGTPPAEKIVVEKKKKPEKHKLTLGKLLGESE